MDQLLASADSSWETDLHCPAVMVNLLGDLWAAGEPRWEQVLRYPEVKLHLYGKREARPGRKMGHFTVLSAQIDHALRLANDIKSRLVAGAQSRPAAAGSLEARQA